MFHNEQIKESIATSNQVLSNGDGQNNVTVARTYHNKPIGYAREFFNQYFSYFSFKHLFLRAEGQYRYYNVPNQGLLFITVLFLILLAFIHSKKLSTSWYLISIYLLILTPLPSAITIDFPPHVHRSMFMIIPLLLLAAYGYTILEKYIHKKTLIFLVILMFLSLESINFWHMYQNHSDAQDSLLRNDGDREIIQYVIEHRNEYDNVYMPIFERLPMYYLFYSNNFSSSVIGTFHTELRADQFDNVVFLEDWCPTKLLPQGDLPKNSLFINRNQCAFPDNVIHISTTYRKDGTGAYDILSTKFQNE